jgi:hypothetical protein
VAPRVSDRCHRTGDAPRHRWVAAAALAGGRCEHGALINCGGKMSNRSSREVTQAARILTGDILETESYIIFQSCGIKICNLAQDREDPPLNSHRAVTRVGMGPWHWWEEEIDGVAATVLFLAPACWRPGCRACLLTPYGFLCLSRPSGTAGSPPVLAGLWLR